MALFAQRYQVQRSQHGSRLIIETGRCTSDSETRNAILAKQTRRYVLVAIPQAQGVVLKSLDGTTPIVQTVTPPTIGISYPCVLVEAELNPLAPVQSGGAHVGTAVLAYRRVWQEVGEVVP